MHSRSALIVLSLILVLAPLARGLSVTPETQQLSSPQDQTYQYVYSILNNDPQPRTLTLKFEQFSEYLSDRVSLSKTQFALLPGQAQNIQLSVRPSGLGPETHTLKIGVYDGSERLAVLQLLITVPGTPVEEYAVSVDAKDTTTQDAVPVSVVIANHGNIIGYARLRLTVQQNGVNISSVDYPSTLQILPQKSLSYDLVYTDTLKPGFYTALVSADFPTQTVISQHDFTVRLGNMQVKIKPGEDYVLTFASVGNPPAVTYNLTDAKGAVRAQGTFLPQTGDMVIPTSTLEPGTYQLNLKLPHNEQHMSIEVQSQPQYLRIAIVLFLVLVIGYAGYTSKNELRLRYRIWVLERAITRRERVVNNLINRTHRLVDHLYERRREARGGARTPP